MFSPLKVFTWVFYSSLLCALLGQTNVSQKDGKQYIHLVLQMCAFHHATFDLIFFEIKISR